MSEVRRSYERKLLLLWAMAFTPKSGNHHPYDADHGFLRRCHCGIGECGREPDSGAYAWQPGGVW